MCCIAMGVSDFHTVHDKGASSPPHRLITIQVKVDSQFLMLCGVTCLASTLGVCQSFASHPFQQYLLIYELDPQDRKLLRPSIHNRDVHYKIGQAPLNNSPSSHCIFILSTLILVSLPRCLSPFQFCSVDYPSRYIL